MQTFDNQKQEPQTSTLFCLFSTFDQSGTRVSSHLFHPNIYKHSANQKPELAIHICNEVSLLQHKTVQSINEVSQLGFNCKVMIYHA